MSFSLEGTESVSAKSIGERTGDSDDGWVSPYLRRRLRSLDEVLAERRAYEDAESNAMASRSDRESKGRVIRLSSAGRRYGKVA